jgi:soluble lytic murein transglycosylase
VRSYRCLFVLIAFFSLQAVAEETNFTVLSGWVRDGKTEKAYKELQETSDSKFAYEQLHLKYFALGQWANDLKRFSEARAHFAQAMKYGQVHAAQIYYLIGHTYKEEAQYANAGDAFRRALDFNPSQNIIYQTRFELSEVALAENKPARAYDHLKYLEKRWRGTPNYPEILWRLMGVEFKTSRRHLACRWARKLYSRYPSHALLKNWSIELQENKFENGSIGCLASNKDIRDRIRHMNLSGMADQAKREIDLLKSRARPHDLPEVDMLLVNYLENQGYPDEALALLIKYYESSKKSFNYQNLLGKVASRAGEFQMAVGAYYNAYKLSPRSKDGRNALFTSAFMSYQIQDYDGAYRKFSDVVKKYQGSGLARDAKWHLAWLDYLKGDFKTAEISFKKLLDEKQFLRRRRVVRPFNNERTQYWLAMTYMRQNKNDDARKIFKKLEDDKSMSFYAISAKNRLKQLPDASTEAEQRRLASINDAENLSETTPAEVVEAAPPQILFSPSGEIEKKNAEDDSEETLQTTNDSDDSDVDADTDEAAAATDGPKLEAVQEDKETPDEASGEIVSATSFRDPRLRERFHRANDYITLGLNDWAKWELFEIERRTTNKTYLKTLMDAYNKIGSYNRASYIAEIYFGSERSRMGIVDGKEYWQQAYPKAYAPVIENYAKKFGVPEALVLAIMRAESHFNREALSPVGARGLMQIMSYTANHLSRLLKEGTVADQDLYVPETNIKLGARYLARLQFKFEKQVPLVAAGYNAGPHRVYNWLSNFGSLDMDEFIEHVPFVETRNYMKKVVRNYAIYTELYGSKSDTYVWLTQPISMHVGDRPSPRENWEVSDSL